MAQQATRAGGCFLTIFILLGFVGGLAIRNPVMGCVIGTGIGTAVAVAIWLMDRRGR